MPRARKPAPGTPGNPHITDIYVVCRGIRGESGQYISGYVPVYLLDTIRNIQDRYRDELSRWLLEFSHSAGGAPSPGDFRCSFSYGTGSGSNA
jgi:hypothetical protein